MPAGLSSAHHCPSAFPYGLLPQDSSAALWESAYGLLCVHAWRWQSGAQLNTGMHVGCTDPRLVARSGEGHKEASESHDGEGMLLLAELPKVQDQVVQSPHIWLAQHNSIPR